MNGVAISQTKGALKAILELNGEQATFGRVSHSAQATLARRLFSYNAQFHGQNFVLSRLYLLK